MNMKIAVTYENEMVGQHFGRTEQFKIYNVEDGKITSSEVVGTNGAGHGALIGFLQNLNVNMLICGGIGMGARNSFADADIKLFPGVSGNADEAVDAYLSGSLAFDPDAQCNHHHGEGEEHGHGCHGGDHGCH